MKLLIPIILLSLLASCAIQNNIEVQPKQKYMTLNILKAEYSLSNDKLKAIRKAYLKGKITRSYNAGIGEVCSPEGDHSKH